MTLQNIAWTAAMVFAVAALGGLMVIANLHPGRTDAELAVADRCMAWAHQPRDAQQADIVLATQCETYFHVRTDSDADEDDARWAKRADAAQHADSGH
jgi:hypothetical protein